ncbi:cytochrome o ubiquinol oxidase subunit III [Candidatus Saccharibacteria bacterium]|nr:cytochrome o ubiquinol oxidase subunit III [Candidatus Saccharibacteria bacterium]
MTRNSTERKVEQYEKAELGFWLYLMTDIILFASLFATYMVLRPNVAGGPSAAELLDPRYALIETVVLLLSSFTCGIAVLALRFKRTRLALAMLGTTIVFGAVFLALELFEFGELIHEGHTWQQSAFLSGFFTLVATHGLHITFGIIWGLVMLLYIAKRGSTANSVRKMTLFSLFWHFLDLVWIFIFTIVYLGAGL